VVTMRREDSIGTRLWEWVAPSRQEVTGPDMSTETEANHADLVSANADAAMSEMKRNGSIGSQMFNWQAGTPPRSRESSLHGGNSFGSAPTTSNTMKRVDSGIWNWGTDRAPPGMISAQNAEGPDKSAFEERDRGEMYQESADVAMAQMKRNGSIGSQLFAWGTSWVPSPGSRSAASSRNNSLRGGSNFASIAEDDQAAKK